MRNIFLVAVVLLISINCSAQKNKSQKKLLTYKFGGTYGYGKGHDVPSGKLLVYPETDSTVLFYMHASTGKPAFNSGMLFGRVQVRGESGQFLYKFNFADGACQLAFQFLKNTIEIKTIQDAGGCGFGNGVQADGTYKLISSFIPQYFENGEGKEIFFKDADFEKYYIK
jgi:hypothetical protein